MKTKYFITTILVCIIAGQFTFAQPPQGGRPQFNPEDRAKQETQWMKTTLTLTDAQIPQIDTINLKYAKKQMELRNQVQGGDREAMRSKRQELQNQKNEELKKVLSEDQMKKYLDELEKRRANMGQGRPRPQQQPQQ